MRWWRWWYGWRWFVGNDIVEYLNKGYPQSTIKKDKPLRKPRQKLRPQRQNEPKPRTGRLDHCLTRTRLARRDASTTEKSPTHTTLGRASRPTSLTDSETKVKAFNATANHFLPHGYSGNQHGSSTSVKSHFLLPISGWAMKTCQYTCHAEHYSATDHHRGRVWRVSYPEIPGTRPYPFTVDPPRPILDPTSTNHRSNKEARLACHRNPESFHRLILYVTMVSGDGRPFSGHVATTASKLLNKTSLLRHPGVPASSWPYKRAGRGLYEGGDDGQVKKSVTIPP
jgi:hypothetical protein